MKQLAVSEWCEWYRHYEASPWGAEVEQLNIARLCAVIANSSGRYKSSLKPADFMPGKPQEQTAADQKNIMKSLMAAQHGT